jgi:hypothetical protein
LTSRGAAETKDIGPRRATLHCPYPNYHLSAAQRTIASAPRVRLLSRDATYNGLHTLRVASNCPPMRCSRNNVLQIVRREPAND